MKTKEYYKIIKYRKMKRFSLIITTAVILLGIMSCNKIEGPYMKDIVVSGDRVVLLEDYTGVKCINCPEAAVTAHELLERFPDNLVVLSVHSGHLAAPFPGEQDLRTEAGSTWYEAFNFDHNPVGTINRTRVSGGFGYDPVAWGTKVAEEVNKKPEALLYINSVYDEMTRKLDFEVSGEFTQEIDGDFYIFAGIMEDSIQGKQLFPGSQVDDHYWHCHVFRKPVNGIWGERFYTGMTELSQEFQKQFSTTIDSIYNADQCYVFAYVYDNSDYGAILQAGQVKIK